MRTDGEILVGEDLLHALQHQHAAAACPLARHDQANPNAPAHDHPNHTCWFGCAYHLTGLCMTQPGAVDRWNDYQKQAHAARVA